MSHVYNYDLPQDREDYVHRIGRTARAGESGQAISLACDEYVFSLPDIEEYIEQKIPTDMIDDSVLDFEIKAAVRSERSAQHKHDKRHGNRNNGHNNNRPRRHT